MFRVILSLAVVLAIGSQFSRIASAEEVKCEGTITKIDGEKVTIKTPANQEQHMWVVPATKVMVDGKAAKPTDLKIGERVKCTCNKDVDKMTCNMIEASSQPK
jgi:hypothetical protein